MHKNALFLLINCKNFPVLGASHPDPNGLRRLGALPPAAGGSASGGWGLFIRQLEALPPDPHYATTSTDMTEQ